MATWDEEISNLMCEQNRLICNSCSYVRQKLELNMWREQQYSQKAKEEKKSTVASITV
jgi:hypothetical protein